MKDRRRNQIEPKDFARLDRLLESLKKVPVPDLPLAVKDRLNASYAQRLRENPTPRVQVGGQRQRLSFWLKPVTALALLIAVSVVAMFLVHLHQRGHLQTRTNPELNAPRESPNNGVSTASELPTPGSSLRPNSHAHFARVNYGNPTEMIVRLPYSDSNIATGTSATIQVSMSQSELISLGFPLTESLQNRQIIAKLTLGDDGLPRAISLPLPLEVIK